MNNVKRVVDLALSEVGYLEKKNNQDLDSKTANAGQNNYTKYARDLDAVKYFNGNKQGYAWCSVFLHWLFYKLYGKEKAVAILYEPSTSNYGAGVDYLYGYFKNARQTQNKPQIGDLIVFKSATYNFAHVGLVVDVDATKVYTVEGNTSGASGVIANGGGVCKKSYLLSYKNIVGYCRPNWDLVGGYDYVKETKKSDGECTVILPILKIGQVCDAVKALQTLLVGYGYGVGTAGADGDFGNDTKKAVMQYQQRNKECGAVDGVVGSKTWESLLGVEL